MKLKTLHLHLRDYGPDKPTYQGTVEVQGKKGEIELRISGDQGQRLLHALGEALVDSARDLVEELGLEMATAAEDTRDAIKEATEVDEA